MTVEQPDVLRTQEKPPRYGRHQMCWTYWKEGYQGGACNSTRHSAVLGIAGFRTTKLELCTFLQILCVP